MPVKKPVHHENQFECFKEIHRIAINSLSIIAVSEHNSYRLTSISFVKKTAKRWKEQFLASTVVKPVHSLLAFYKALTALGYSYISLHR